MPAVLGTSSAGGTSKDNEGPLHVKELGLTQIDGRPVDHPFIADVVFVHGLQGHPRRTWESKSPSKPAKTFQDRLKRISLSKTKTPTLEAQDVAKPLWPADILPRDFENVRILTFGYDSKVTKGFMGPTSKNGIFQHGNSFLRALSRIRSNCSGRPIIFVAHSLGGLVVKQALIEARKQTADSFLQDICTSAHGIIFFGTPHRGSKGASWGLMLSAIAQAVQLETNSAILRDLDPESGSSKLEELMLDFDDILRDVQRDQELRVFSFQEEEGMAGIKIFGGKVVPNETSSLDSRKYGNDTIHANHMGMCRFEDENDDGYEKFKGVLGKLLQEIKSERSAINVARRADLLHILEYSERRARECQLQNMDADEKTFSWIWSSSSSFKDWLSGREGVYWISGKPGSGKSTMVAHLVAHDRTILELQKQDDMKWTILHFYFDFRGGKGINNSFEGLLRSLLYQLVEAIPQLDVKDVDDGKSGRFSDWSERRLRTVLRTSLENATGGVCIFVDGLDEYEGDDVLELIQFLKSLAPSKDSRRTSIKVCVSSRPEAIPSQLLGHLPNLSMSDYNESGIRSYCLRTLEGLEPEVRKDLDMLRLSRIMANRAEGVFLWARFALDEVVQGHFSGENFDEILVRLRSIPLELEDVYDRMLSRIEPTAKQECMIMLQLVCFAKRELSWQELLVAVNTAMDKDVVFSEIPCDKDPAYAPKVYDTFAKRLRAKAVGLLEIIKIEHWEKRSGKMVMVMVEALKLIHRSVSTYLNQKGWQTLGALKGEASIGAESLYVETCTRYLQCLLRHCKMENETIQRIRKWLQGKVFYNVRSDLIRTSAGIYPFFAYAACYVFKHAASLERHGSSSYPLFHDALTEQLVSLIITCQAKSEYYTPSSLSLVPDLLLKDFDAIFVAFLHGLVLYCTNDLATRSPAPGQVFWERALRCALLGEAWQLNSNTKTLSLALQNVVTVKQIHLEEAVSSESLELVLQHDSVRRLRLVDRKGQAVTLPWLFNKYIGFDSLGKILNLLIERGNDRGEDVRQRWSPERNLVETLMKQSPNPERAEKLRTLRKYYESRSWPFEYDPRETERFYDSDDIDRE